MRRWVEASLLLVFGWVLALHLSSWLMPGRSAPLPAALQGEWIRAPDPGFRAYFRHEFELSFAPEQAWLILATDDYELFVNGVSVSNHRFSTNASLPFTNRMSDRAQSLNPLVAVFPRAPERRRAPNEEWRVGHVIDLTAFLRPGRNLLAISVQSAHAPMFTYRGVIAAPGHRVELNARAADWRATAAPDRNLNEPWFRFGPEVGVWRQALGAGYVRQRIHLTIPEAVWATPYTDASLVGRLLGDRVTLALDLPPLLPFEHPRSAWLRVYSPWPAVVLLDDHVVGTAPGGSDAVAFDLTALVALRPMRLTIRMRRPDLAAQDPPLLHVAGQIGTSELGVAAGWRTLVADGPRWLDGSGDWQRADHGPRLQAPRGLRLQPVDTNLGARTLLFLGLWALTTAALAATLLAVRMALTALTDARRQAMPAAYLIVSVPIAVVVAIEFLRWRAVESDVVLLLLDPANFAWIYLAAPVFGLIALVVLGPSLAITSRAAMGAGATTPTDGRDLSIVWLIAFTLLGLVLRLTMLEIDDLQADENVSYDAARGILRTGVPQSTSGIYYTRSPLYHYMLAGWLYLFGDTVAAARAFSVVLGTAVLPAVYLLVVTITRRPTIALLAVLIMAIDPWMIHLARNIRFYQQMQFFSIITIYFFIRGFIWQEGKSFQNYFFLFCTLSALSQEVFIVTFPGFCIAAFLFYRPFRLAENWNVVFGFAAMMIVIIFDLFVFAVVCLTPHVGIATSSASIMQFHVLFPYAFPNTFFIGNLRSSLLFSALFVIGVIGSFFRPVPAVVTLQVLIVATLVTVTVLVVQVAARYLFAIYPLLIITAVIAADDTIRRTAHMVMLRARVATLLPTVRRWSAIMFAIAASLFLVNQDLYHLAKSYTGRINLAHKSGFQYIADHYQAGDRIISASPMAAAIVLNRLDYYLMNLVFFDEVYRTPAGVVDRWSGGTLISKVDQLRDVLLSNERVWLMVDESEVRTFDRELALFVDGTGTTVYEFFGGRVILWEREGGRLPLAPDRGGAIDTF